MSPRAALAASVVVVFSFLETSTGHAGLLADEPFAYSVGANLAGQTGGAGWGGTAWGEYSNVETNVTSDTIASGSLTFSTGGATLVTSGNHLLSQGTDSGNYRIASSDVPIVTTYFSILMRRDTAGTGNSSTYGGLVIDGNNGGAGLFIGDPGVNDFISAGKAGDDTGIQASTTQLVQGTTYLLVGKVTLAAGADTLRLYVNPTPGAAEPGTAAATYNALDIGSAIHGVEIIAGYTATWSFDEFRFGDSFASVTPAVPEPSSAAVMFAGLGLLWKRRR